KPPIYLNKIGNFATGGVCLKISEPISLTGSADGIPPELPFRPPHLEAEAKRTISSSFSNPN
ncbi:hypothetical protein COS59_01635, partial [Candidatus Wolfebacteria bacterium CG03_land_8_20_14_0_80_36_15]